MRQFGQMKGGGVNSSKVKPPMITPGETPGINPGPPAPTTKAPMAGPDIYGGPSILTGGEMPDRSMGMDVPMPADGATQQDYTQGPGLNDLHAGSPTPQMPQMKKKLDWKKMLKRGMSEFQMPQEEDPMDILRKQSSMQDSYMNRPTY